MIVYGYAKEYRYTGDGTMEIRVRIPNVHGPYRTSDAKGRTIRNYVDDDKLPYYPSLLLPTTPTEGDVVALTSMNDKSSDFLILGLTGGNYSNGMTID